MTLTVNITANQIIAQALRELIEQDVSNSDKNNLYQDDKNRLFFRVDGFDNNVYQPLIESFKISPNLVQHPVEVYSLDQINLPGFEGFAIAKDKTATYYRNRLEAGKVLILLFPDNPPSDAQSLADLHNVNESRMVREGLLILIKVALELSGTDQNNIDSQTIEEFLNSWSKVLPTPSLRVLTSFLLDFASAAKNNDLSTEGTITANALVSALPALDCFRIKELIPRLDKTNGKLQGSDLKRLKQVYEASQVGKQPLEFAEMERLNKLVYKNFGENTEIATVLKKFIEQGYELDNREALTYDWEVVGTIFGKKVGPGPNKFEKTRNEILVHLGINLTEGIDNIEIGEDDKEIIRDLTNKDQPDINQVEEFLERNPSLPKKLKQELRKLANQLPPSRGQNFPLLVVKTAIELILKTWGTLDQSSAPNFQLKISTKKPEKETLEIKRAVHAFRALYGGIEQFFPSITWELNPLMEKANQFTLESTEPDNSEEDNVQEEEIDFESFSILGSKEEQVKPIELVFKLDIELKDNNSIRIPSAEIIWVFQADSGLATFANVLCYTDLGAYIFQAVHPEQSIQLSRPGHWYNNYYRKELLTEVEKADFLDDDHLHPMLESIKNLSSAYLNFGTIARQEGLFKAYSKFEILIENYQRLLETGQDHLLTDIAKEQGLPLLNQLWVVKGSEWAAVTPLHPLKLICFYNRIRFFNTCIEKLKEAGNSQAVLANEKVFVREIDTLSSSAGFPIVLSLTPDANTSNKYFVPVSEELDFELYLPNDRISSELGLVENVEDDGRAVDILSRIVNEYLDTYPFSEQGMQLVIVNCTSGDLPKALIEAIYKKQSGVGRDLNINFLVHTIKNGPVIYQELSKWLESNEIGHERKESSYLPKIAVTVVEAPNDKIGSILNAHHSGLVMLANVFQNGAELIGEQSINSATPNQYQAFLPTFQAKLKPTDKNALRRDFALNQPDEPEVVRSFYRLQYCIKNYLKELKRDHQVLFLKQIKIHEWKPLLLKLHEHFNWVVCYDVNTDRRLLQNECGLNNVSVIRYTTGLGPKRQHNLTTSSSNISQDAVQQRLLTKVRSLLPQQSDEQREKLANWWVTQAREISGDLVLRATGPGTLVNELIGVVLTRHTLDNQVLSQINPSDPNKVRIWLSADDYRHWFESGGSNNIRPDLIGVEISVQNGQLTIKIIIAESKYIGGDNNDNFDNQHKKAIQQIRSGLLTMQRTWSPQKPFLDSEYWYDQFYRAIAAQLELSSSQNNIGVHLKLLQSGNFQFIIEGHACVFTHKASPAALGEQTIVTVDEHNNTPDEFSAIADICLYSHLHSPKSLASIIKNILQTDEEIELGVDNIEEEILDFEETRKDLILNSAAFERAIAMDYELPADIIADFRVEEEPPMTKENYTEEQIIAQNEPENIETVSGKELPGSKSSSSVKPDEFDFDLTDSLDDIEDVPTKFGLPRDLSTQPTPNVPLVDFVQNQVEETHPLILEHSTPKNIPQAEPPTSVPDMWTPPGKNLHSQFLSLLKHYDATGEDQQRGQEQANEAKQEIQRVFQAKAIRAQIVDAVIGPRVIRIKVTPQLSSKDYHKQIQGLGDVLKQRLSLPAEPQIEIGSDGTIWIDIARRHAVTIGLNSLLSSPEMNQSKAETRFPIGMSLEGQTEWGDLRKTAHWLIGGTSGSGKSIFLRSILLSLMYNNTPDTLQLILLDPKADMAAFQKLPFVTDYIMGTESAEEVAHRLGELYEQMQARIKHMTNSHQTNDIDNFHTFEGRLIYPRVVVVIEEYATLLDSIEKTRKEIEQQVRRISAVGRSSGFHMFICTQNPLSSTLGSSLKANLSGRVALKVQSKDNSQVILDSSGAEKLLKNGDMLYYTEGGELKRLQAPFVSEPELHSLISLLTNYYKTSKP